MRRPALIPDSSFIQHTFCLCLKSALNTRSYYRKESAAIMLKTFANDLDLTKSNI
jgi:hypothetical protein